MAIEKSLKHARILPLRVLPLPQSLKLPTLLMIHMCSKGDAAKRVESDNCPLKAQLTLPPVLMLAPVQTETEENRTFFKRSRGATSVLLSQIDSGSLPKPILWASLLVACCGEFCLAQTIMATMLPNLLLFKFGVWIARIDLCICNNLLFCSAKSIAPLHHLPRLFLTMNLTFMASAIDLSNRFPLIQMLRQV